MKLTNYSYIVTMKKIIERQVDKMTMMLNLMNRSAVLSVCD